MYIFVYDMNKSSYFCRYLIFKLISLRKKMYHYFESLLITRIKAPFSSFNL